MKYKLNTQYIGYPVMWDSTVDYEAPFIMTLTSYDEGNYLADYKYLNSSSHTFNWLTTEESLDTFELRPLTKLELALK